jgi:hypothetical protein
MLSVSLYDVDIADAFAALLRDKPYRYLRAEGWPRDLPNPWPEDDEWPGPLLGDLIRAPISAWGGFKAPDCKLWLGVLNYADLPKIRAQFAAMPWRVPNAVQLMLMDQDEIYFRVWMIRDGELHQHVTPEPDDQVSEFWPDNWRDLHPQA